MKQVTIDTVKARIAEMENIQNTTTIGISLREEFELACLRELLAAMDSEPVAYIDKQWTLVYYVPPMSMGLKIGDKLYRHAQPAPERDKVRAEHAEWSQATFGGVGPIGPLKHLSIEALEAAEAPGDLSEWADLQFLMWDAQRRAGITDEQITQAMIDKLAVNKARTWPEPKDGEPRLHIQADNDNTAQQFEALATSAPREPLAVVKHYTGNEYPTLKFAQDEWCVCGDREDAQELADAINALATSSGSGKP